MRIMLLGAGGFIGRHIMAELLAAGHELVGVVRSKSNLNAAFPTVRFLSLDLALATDKVDWEKHLNGIECIINAAGILRGPEMDEIHVQMPNALYQAAMKSAVRQAILISAVSAREDVATDYSISKLSGEEVLRRSGLDWTILRPSLVYGEGSYGGTSLLRGMAALPFLIPLPANGEFVFAPIHVQDLARGVNLICGDEAYCGQTLEPVGPETVSLRELLARYRAWLGFGDANFISIPMPVMHMIGRVGDLLGRGPISTNSLSQLAAGNGGDSVAFEKAIGFSPRSMKDAMLARPAEVQDRWHGRLFFLAPAIKAILVLVWLASAWLGLFHGETTSDAVISGLGLPQDWADPLRVGGSLLDLGVAFLVLSDKHLRWSTVVQISVVLGYTVVIGIAQPALWLDPLGPLLKNLPIVALIAVHGVIGNKR